VRIPIETIEALNEIRRLCRRKIRWDWHRDAISEAIRNVSASGTWAAIPELLPLALDPSADAAAPARDAIANLMKQVPEEAVPSLDIALRETDRYDSWFAAWIQLDPDRIPTIGNAALLTLATAHPNGYVRESAIRTATEGPEEVPLSWLVERTCDWVHAVRNAAIAAVKARLGEKQLREIVPLVPRFEALEARSRSAGLIDHIDQLLSTDDAIPDLWAGTQSSSQHVRQSCFDRLQRSPSVDSERVAQRALGDPALAIRSAIARSLCKGGATSFDRFAPMLLGSDVASIRAAALHRIRNSSIGDYEVPWDRLALDPHQQIRALAQDELIDRDRDPADLYRAEVGSQSSKIVGAALQGLVETGIEADIATVVERLSDPRSRVRKSALFAIARSKFERRTEHVITALRDPATRVHRAARQLLTRSGMRRRTGASALTPRLDPLWDVYSGAPNEATRRNTVRAARAIPDRFEYLTFLIRVLQQNDPSLDHAARSGIEGWLA